MASVPPSGRTPCEDYADQIDAIIAVQPQTPENLNNALSFPYPEMSGPVRPPGKGCQICVHQTYCPALYWFRRNTQREPDNYNGRNCASWSEDEADQIPEMTTGTGNDFDNAENARRNCDGVLIEANPSGISGAITGSSHNSGLIN